MINKTATVAPVALVTGSSKGIGRHLAERFLQSGYLVIGCSRSGCEWSADNYTHVKADITSETDILKMMKLIRVNFGRLDVLINNAGISSMNHALFIPATTFERIIKTNLIGSFVTTREAAKLMRLNKYGRIVNLTTVAVPMVLEGESAYAASKGGIETVTRVLARELAEYGITVNAVGPPPIETDLIRGVPKAKIQAIVNRLAIKRLGVPEDVWNVIEFFIRPESSYVTGQLIYLGGI